MFLKFIILSLFVVSCSTKKSQESHKNSAEPVNPKPDLVDVGYKPFPNALTQEKMSNLWKYEDKHNSKIEYYYFKDEFYKKCVVNQEQNLVFKNRSYKFILSENSEMIIYNLDSSVNDMAKVFMPFDSELVIEFKSNDLQVITKLVDVNSAEKEKVINICQF